MPVLQMKAALRSQMTPQGKLELVPVLHFFCTFLLSAVACYFMSVHHEQGRRLFPPSVQEWFYWLLSRSSILFSLDQTTPFLSIHVGLCSLLIFFLWIFSVGLPRFEVQCSNSANVWVAILPGMSSVKGLSHKHCRLCASLHTAVWCLPFFVTRCHSWLVDNILGLWIKMFSWQTSLSPLFSFSVCTANYFCLRIGPGTCLCEFYSFQTIFSICQDHLNCNFIPLFIWGPSQLDIVWKRMSIHSSPSPRL